MTQSRCTPAPHGRGQLNRPSTQRRTHLFLGTLKPAARVVSPELTGFLFADFSNTVAHTQRTMDFSGADALKRALETSAVYVGTVIFLGGVIFVAYRMMSGRFPDAIPGLFGARFGPGSLAWSRWIATARVWNRR